MKKMITAICLAATLAACKPNPATAPTAVLDGMFTAGFVALPRLMVRSIGLHQSHVEHVDASPVLIAGAGAAGV